MAIAGIRGFKDILPGDVEKWQFIENKAREVFEDFGFREIKIPILEKTELFARSIGQDTDIVKKEMYSFEDRKGESLTLRPEATASVLRAYIEHSMYRGEPIQKLYCMGPMFRYERPQKGRYRQFHQINAEVLGVADPKMDVEIVVMLSHLLKRLGLKEINLEINSLGCSRCRPRFKEALVPFFGAHLNKLCTDCRQRLVVNPLRIMDCKIETCNDLVSSAPLILDFLCHDCLTHFDAVKGMLGLFEISYVVNPRIVRGLDYYTRTAFEITTPLLGAQNAIAGGGRYDNLLKELGGPDLPGIGFAIGVERLVLLLENRNDLVRYPKVFVAALGSETKSKAFELSMALRLKGVWTEMDYEDKSLKSQMRRANKLKANYTLIIGEQELESGSAILKDMESGKQVEVNLGGGADELLQKLPRFSDKVGQSGG